jgi:ketosteroid isomerase-like protein
VSTRALCTILVAATLAGFGGCRARPSDSAASGAVARRDIAEAGRRFSAAYVAGDTATIGSLYTEDAVLLPPGAEIRGRAAIVRYFAPGPNRRQLAHAMVSGSLEVRGSTAIDVGRWSSTWQRGNGEPQTAGDRYLIVWLRGADGAWRISHDVWHRPPAD